MGDHHHEEGAGAVGGAAFEEAEGRIFLLPDPPMPLGAENEHRGETKVDRA